MPSVLRKRAAPVAQPAVIEPAAKKKKSATAKVSKKPKESVTSPSPIIQSPQKDEKSKKKSVSSSPKVAVGDTINLDGFGGEIETHEGEKTTLQKLVDESKGGVVLFTYPKASTPGCTTQACLFRDQYAELTSTGFSIYGLSKDSTKANTNFKTKQNLPYQLLCNPSASLIKAIGLSKAPSGITRGVFVVNKSGNVLAAQAGGPAATVEVVKKLVESDNTESAASNNSDEEKVIESKPAEEEESKPSETCEKKNT